MKTLTKLTLAIVCTLLATTAVAGERVGYKAYLPDNGSCVAYVREYERSLKLPRGKITLEHKVQLSWIRGYMTGTNIDLALPDTPDLRQRATLYKEAMVDAFQDHPPEIARGWIYQRCRKNLKKDIDDMASQLYFTALITGMREAVVERALKIGE